jgi:hypothetical protein
VNTIFSNVKTDRQFCATTGFTKEQFYDLVYEFDQTEQQLFREPLNNYQPVKFISNVEERLFFTLFYLKVYPTFDVLGISFGMDGSTTEHYVQLLQFVLEKTLQRLKMLPLRSTQNEKEMQALLSTAEKLFIDATEHRIQRPENQAEQQDAYSGKKKPIR